MMGFELLLLIGVIAFFVWGGQQGWSIFRRGEATQSTSALDLLEKRYAEGEIERDEFQERRALLER